MTFVDIKQFIKMEHYMRSFVYRAASALLPARIVFCINKTIKTVKHCAKFIKVKRPFQQSS